MCTKSQTKTQKHTKTNTRARSWWETVSYHVLWKRVTGQVLHILVLSVDYFRQLAPVHHLLEHPHFDGVVEFCILRSIGTHYLGNGRTPVVGTVEGLVLR